MTSQIAFADGPPLSLPFRDKKASYEEQKEILSQVPCVFLVTGLQISVSTAFIPLVFTPPASGLLGSGERSQSSSSPLP